MTPTSEAAALRRELLNAWLDADVVYKMLHVKVWEVGRLLLTMDVDKLRDLKAMADALRKQDAASADLAAALPVSARDAATSAGWRASATAETLQRHEEEEDAAAALAAAAGEDETAATTITTTTTLAQQRPPGMRRGSSGSAVLDAMLELVGMASGGIATGEASPSMRLTPTSSPSRQVSVIAAA